MDKKVKIMMFMIISVFLMIGFSNVVSAEENQIASDVCPNSSKVELLQNAAMVKINYEPYEQKADGFDDPNSSGYSVIYYYIDIKIYNMDETIFATVTNGNTGKKFDVYADETGPDGAITIRIKDTTKINTFTFELKANTYDCNSKVLRTVKLTIPKYNYYSGRQVCSDIPDYYLCQQYIVYDVSATRFLESVTNYKADLAENNSESKEEEVEPSIISKAASKISKYKYWIVGGILLVGVIVTIIVIKKKRSSVL